VFCLSAKWYQQITETLQQPLKREKSYQAFVKLNLPGKQPWGLRKIIRLVLGIRAEGISFLLCTIKLYIETLWILMKINLKLFWKVGNR
jgi:hypothetical protein